MSNGLSGLGYASLTAHNHVCSIPAIRRLAFATMAGMTVPGSRSDLDMVMSKFHLTLLHHGAQSRFLAVLDDDFGVA